jgi:hypothetical protein
MLAGKGYTCKVNLGLGAGLPDFTWPKYTKTGKVYMCSKLQQTIQNGHKLYQIVTNYNN